MCAAAAVHCSSVSTITASTAATITCLANIGRPSVDGFTLGGVPTVRDLSRQRQRSVGDDDESDAGSISTLEAAHDEAIAAMLQQQASSNTQAGSPVRDWLVFL
jgi:hypothetical protein